MREIRKIWIGDTIKGDGSMSWHIGQEVGIGGGRTAIVDHIIEIEGGYEVHIRKEKMVMPWKKTSMKVTVEYDINF